MASHKAHGHDEKNIEPSKFIQIEVVKRKGYRPELYALDDCGRIWLRVEVEVNLQHEWDRVEVDLQHEWELAS